MAASSSPSLLSISSTATGANNCHGSGTTMMSPAASFRYRPACVSAERPPPAFTSDHIASPTSPYKVLGIRNGATCQEIKAAYRRLARLLHPDVASASSSSSDRMGREFMMVHEAYATLSDPDKRAYYDREMTVAVGPCPSSVRAGCGSGFRTTRWETDQCW